MFRLESREQRRERLERIEEKKRQELQEARWAAAIMQMGDTPPRPMTAGDLFAPDNFATEPRLMIGADIGIVERPMSGWQYYSRMTSAAPGSVCYNMYHQSQANILSQLTGMWSSWP